jgi:hypothetical protein
MIAALAVSLSVSTLLAPSGPAHAAETCLAAPNSPAPQGSHWYYRLDRASQRKCWHLVQADKQTRSAAAREAPQPTSGAALPALPIAGQSAEAPIERPQAPAWITRNVRATTSDAAVPLQPPDPREGAAEPQDGQIPSGPSAAQAQTSDAAEVQAAGPVVERPVQRPIVATDNAVVPAAAKTGMVQFVFVALAVIGLLGGAFFYAVAVRRRRGDVLNTVARANGLALEIPAAADGPTFAPLPPISLMLGGDDFEEAPRRLQAWTRRAA